VPLAKKFWLWLDEPTWALPLDIFRILVGIIELAFFASLIREAADFSAPDGLIDHQLSLTLFPYTRYSLIPAGASSGLLQFLFLIGCVCCCALILGYRPKLAAGIAYAILVSTYRRDFLVIYIDDCIVHLMFLWMLLLPIGRTLNISAWLSDGDGVWRQWKRTMIPGCAVRCFIWNVAILYIVAGAWKWTSPMWRDGTAVYAVMKLPISYQAGFWGPQHSAILMILNYLTLVLEPLFPLISFFPARHVMRYGIAAVAATFHLFMLATLQVPFANVVCLAAVVVVLRDEIASWLGASQSMLVKARTRPGVALSAMSLSFVILLSATMITEAAAPEWRSPTIDGAPVNPPVLGIVDPSAGFLESAHDALLKVLWSVGVAQGYQLFNWIDHRNFRYEYEIEEAISGANPRTIAPSAMFPQSTRGVLLQSYMHGVTWTSIPRDQLRTLKQSLFTRVAQRYCRRDEVRGVINIYSSVQRIVPKAPDSAAERHLLLSFTCGDDGARADLVGL
jgi:hypothetical protein